MTDYPIIVRNRIPFFYRGSMLVFLGGVALITYLSFREGFPGPEKWWPYILAIFWLAGLGGLWWSLGQEVSLLEIDAARSIRVRRGKAFRRVEHRVGQARFRIEDTKDSEGDPYFKLMMDAPGGPLAVKEGHQRERLEAVKDQIEAALRQR